MLRRLARIALWVITGFIIGWILLVALYRYLPSPGTPLMLLRRVEGCGIQKSWTSFDQISANLVRAVIASEDSRFCNHHGFDWNAIETAWDRYRRWKCSARQFRPATPHPIPGSLAGAAPVGTYPN
jgi:monofunctional biosynthetic peptidoglycan transglycosylase